MFFLSPAKLNLGLRIIGRRSDGYHFLQSLFWPIDLCDEISIEQSSKNKISMEWENSIPIKTQLPKEAGNSIYRLLSSNPQLGTWAIHVKKKIPIGGGLGGSSSNAGTVLKFFREQGFINNKKTQDLALSLGADVPFFLEPVPTWVQKIGEDRTPIKINEKPLGVKFHLLFTKEACLTKEVFTVYRNSGIPFSKQTKISKNWSRKTLENFLAKTRNDLESSAITLVPQIAETLRFLRSFQFLYVGLSGSGSACFAVSSANTPNNSFSKEIQLFCRSSPCSYIEANTFSA